MKNFLILIALNICITAYADTLTLKQLIEAAVAYNSTGKHEKSYGEIAKLREKIALSYKLPQISLNGQLTYQSDVVSFSENPMFQGPEIPKLQGKSYFELSHVIYNGNKSEIMASIDLENVKSDQLNWEKELENLTDRLEELYFNTLLLTKRQDILSQTLEENRRQRNTLVNLVDNGLRSQVDLNILM